MCMKLALVECAESKERKQWDALGSRVVQLLELSSQIKTTPPFQFIEVITHLLLSIL